MQIALNAATVVAVGRAMMIFAPSGPVAAMASPTLMSDSLASGAPGVEPPVGELPGELACEQAGERAGGQSHRSDRQHRRDG